MVVTPKFIHNTKYRYNLKVIHFVYLQRDRYLKKKYLVKIYFIYNKILIAMHRIFLNFFYKSIATWLANSINQSYVQIMSTVTSKFNLSWCRVGAMYSTRILFSQILSRIHGFFFGFRLIWAKKYIIGIPYKSNRKV